MPNRLAGETSPYLRQHADNPVDWYPWGDEALELARSSQRPLLVSIGYSACHWCHVMAHESFEDPAIAALMNERFVCVKVDREERPDVDAVCMEACQVMTGQGGWPLNAFLTPEQAPFFAGTYFPPEPRHGLPSWWVVLNSIAAAWDKRPDDVRAQGAKLLQALGGATRLQASDEPITEALLEQAVAALRPGFDVRNGGFGASPKFPQASLIEFLLARGERDMSLQMLRAMARGGIYDQVGGGFHRYAVDAAWTVPHFEKMLYDNALLARAYLHGWQVAGEPLLRRVCTETLDWALRELRGDEGGFCAALDADSDGVEGSYYVWTVAELHDALGADLAEPAIAFFGATEHGNFERSNVLEGRGPALEQPQLDAVRTRLYELRERRVRPGTDDKRLCSQNALMISALAQAGAALGEDRYLDAAVACAEFVLSQMVSDDGRLLRTYKDGRAQIDAYLEDHAYLLEAMLTLYEATFDARWYDEAVRLAEVLRDRFADREHGGFFTTAAGVDSGFDRRKELDDAPIPSGGSAAAFGLLRLAALSGDNSYESDALGVLRVVAPIVPRHPAGFGHALQALGFYLARVREVAVVGAPGAEFDRLTAVARGRYRPHLVLAGGRGDDERVPLLSGRGPVDGRPAAYVCEGFVCRAPVTDPDALAAALQA